MPPKNDMKRSLLFAFLASAVLLTTACDFNAASDAVDDFDLVVELPPLATVVNVQAIDATSQNPVAQEVSVTFEGSDASEVIDIYSDPIDQLTFSDGFASFGIDSTRNPSSDEPTRLRLRVQADGYVPTSVPVRITREGSITSTTRLTPDDPEQAPEGTKGRRERTQTDNGATTSNVELQTDQTSDDTNAAQASATIPEGTSLKTSDGRPLQGQVTTDLSVYDNSTEAQNLLPAEALESEDGSRLLVQGALRFTVTDEDGQHAGQFDNADETATSITANLPALDAQNGTPVLVFVNPETGETTRVSASPSSASRTSTGKSHTGSHLLIEGGMATARVGRSAEIAFSSSLLTNALMTFGYRPPKSAMCQPTGELVINRNGRTGPIGIWHTSSGLSIDASFSDPSDPVVITPSDLFDGWIPDMGPVTVYVSPPGSRFQQEQTVTVNWCSGSAETTLPASSFDWVDATVRLVPNCPADQDIPVSGDVDGYTVNYRVAGSSNPYHSVPKEDITISTSGTPEKFNRADVNLSTVRPGEDYEFVGTLGSEGSSTQTITMPMSNNGTVETSDEELNDLCE